MIDKTLKQKAIKGMLWSFCERFGTLFILFIANITLARMLSPEDFGLIGMVTVFVSLSTILIDGGLGSALIQRKNPSHEDYSTIFIVNVGVALGCYAILFICSDFIAGFYRQPQLTILLRILGLALIVDSFSVIQNNILVKNLNFKRITKIKITVAFFASTIAIISALSGLGVWSLVIQTLVNSSLRSIFLWKFTAWHPSLVFKKESFKSLFNFGSKLLLASLLSEGFRNIQLLIIGRFFPAREVGYFTQAKQLENVPVSSLLMVVNQVTYPVFSQMQDSKKDLINGLRRCFKLLAFVNFPVMILLAIVAEPLFLLLFSAKWLPAVPYFQWLCVGCGLLTVIHNTNLNVLKAIGKSDVVLYLEIVKKITGVTLIFIFMRFDVIGILWALALNSFIDFFLNAYYVDKYLSYGICKQAKDLLPILILAVAVGGIVYSISFIHNIHYIGLLFIQVTCYFLLYLLGAHMFKLEVIDYVVKKIKNINS